MVKVWIDNANPDLREMSGDRFMVTVSDELIECGNQFEKYSGDDWLTVLDVVNGLSVELKEI